MSKTVYTTWAGYTVIPLIIKNRGGKALYVENAEITHKDGAPISTPSWFNYRVVSQERPDGVAELVVEFRALTSRIDTGTYTFSVTVSDKQTVTTRTFNVTFGALVNSFSPFDIPQLVFWSHAGRLFGAKDREVVSRWRNSHHDYVTYPENAIQEETDLKPIYFENGMGAGKPALRFDTDDTIRVTHDLGYDKTIFMVCKFEETDASAAEYLFEAGNLYARRIYDSFEDIYNSNNVFVGNWLQVSNGTMSNETAQKMARRPFHQGTDTFIVCVKIKGGDIFVWINGEHEISSWGGGQNTTYLDIGRGMRGYISDLIIYERYLTKDEQDEITTWLGAKHTIPVFTENAPVPFEIGTCIGHYLPEPELTETQSGSGTMAVTLQDVNVATKRAVILADLADSVVATNMVEESWADIFQARNSGPNFAAAGQGNRPYLNFLGYHFLRSSVVAPFGDVAPPFTVVVVFSVDSTEATTGEGWIFDGAAGKRVGLGYRAGSLLLHHGSEVSAAYNLQGSFHVARVEFNPTATNDKVYIDGTLRIDADAGGDVLDQIVLGARYDVDLNTTGNYPTDVQGFKGRVYELMIFSGLLSATELEELNLYLNVRYRL